MAAADHAPPPICYNPPPPSRRIPMSTERTLSIIKPDGVARDCIGAICGRFEQAGLAQTAAAEIAFFFDDMQICPRDS